MVLAAGIGGYIYWRISQEEFDTTPTESEAGSICADTAGPSCEGSWAETFCAGDCLKGNFHCDDGSIQANVRKEACANGCITDDDNTAHCSTEGCASGQCESGGACYDGGECIESGGTDYRCVNQEWVVDSTCGGGGGGGGGDCDDVTTCSSASDCFSMICDYPQATYCTTMDDSSNCTSGVSECQCRDWDDQPYQGCTGEPVCDEDDLPPACPNDKPIDCGIDGARTDLSDSCVKMTSLWCEAHCPGCNNPGRIYRYCRPDDGTPPEPPDEYCGDEICGNTEGETCDPPGDTVVCSGNPDMPSGNECRNDCTYCGDGVLDSSQGEECEYGDPTGSSCGWSDCDHNTCNCPVEVEEMSECLSMTSSPASTDGELTVDSTSTSISITSTGADTDGDIEHIEICWTVGGQSDAYYQRGEEVFTCIDSEEVGGTVANDAYTINYTFEYYWENMKNPDGYSAQQLQQYGTAFATNIFDVPEGQVVKFCSSNPGLSSGSRGLFWTLACNDAGLETCEACDLGINDCQLLLTLDEEVTPPPPPGPTPGPLPETGVFDSAAARLGLGGLLVVMGFAYYKYGVFEESLSWLNSKVSGVTGKIKFSMSDEAKTQKWEKKVVNKVEKESRRKKK